MEQSEVERLFSSREACRALGLTYRQLDYMDHTGVLQPSGAPANGPGTKRRYTEADLARGRALVALRRLGMGCDRLARVSAQLGGHPPGERLLISPEGTVTADERVAAAWPWYVVMNPTPVLAAVA